MKLARIYTGPDNRSHFEELDMPMNSDRRATSAPVGATQATFGESAALPMQDWHHAPRRQLVAVLSGALEVEVGDGSKRRFGVGDVFFADDLTGQGHQTQDVQGPVKLLYVHIPDDFDPTAWRP